MLLAVDLRRAQSPVIGWDSRSHQSKRSRKNANVPLPLIVREELPKDGRRKSCVQKNSGSPRNTCIDFGDDHLKVTHLGAM